MVKKILMLNILVFLLVMIPVVQGRLLNDCRTTTQPYDFLNYTIGSPEWVNATFASDNNKNTVSSCTFSAGGTCVLNANYSTINSVPFLDVDAVDNDTISYLIVHRRCSDSPLGEIEEKSAILPESCLYDNVGTLDVAEGVEITYSLSNTGTPSDKISISCRSKNNGSNRLIANLQGGNCHYLAEDEMRICGVYDVEPDTASATIAMTIIVGVIALLVLPYSAGAALTIITLYGLMAVSAWLLKFVADTV